MGVTGSAFRVGKPLLHVLSGKILSMLSPSGGRLMLFTTVTSPCERYYSSVQYACMAGTNHVFKIIILANLSLR